MFKDIQNLVRGWGYVVGVACVYVESFFFWLHWVFVSEQRRSLVAMSGATLELWCVGVSLQWLLLLQSTGSRVCSLR